MEERLTFPQLLSSVESVYDEERGVLIERIEQAYDQAIRRAQFAAKKAKLRNEVTFEPKENRMLVTAPVETKPPKVVPCPLTAWVDRDGSLSLEDPSQRKLSFPTAASMRKDVPNAG